MSPAPPPRSRNPIRRWWNTITNAEQPLWRRVLVALWGVVLVGGIVGVLGAGALVAYAVSLLPQTPDTFELARATQSQPTVVLAAGGQRLTQFEPAFREWVPMDSIPLHLTDALIAVEDRRFYEHTGVDARRTVGAVWNTVRGRREGGSTITQQLARNLFPEEIGHSGTVTRKIKEAFAARRIEADHTKREILEAYLNTVPFLYNAFGVEMAARTYFGTHAPALTVPQAASLVAMLKGPNQYNPVRHPEAALRRRNLVLQIMGQQGAISAEDAARYQAEPLGVELRPQPATYSAAPHFTAAVRRVVEAWAQPRGYDLDRDGLVVRTTLDLGLQRAAVDAVAERGRRLQATANREWRGGPPRAALDAALRRTTAYARARDAGQSEAEALVTVREDQEVVDSTRARVIRVEASLVALEPETGAVRAYVGSRDFAEDEYDRAGVALRQPGSTFKAFVYAGALQRGYAPEDEIEGGLVTVDMGNGRTWTPTGGSSAGTLADGLAYSKNAVTARLTQEIGPHRVALVAQRMGITSRLDIVPSIGLGTSPVTLLDMVSAYGTVANDGLARTPRLVTRIETASGTVLETFGGTGRQAITRRDARNLLDMLRGVVDRGTGRDLRTLGATGDLAGKTGTTQRHADGWFIALRPGLAVGAWVGFNDQRIHFRSMETGAGSETALPVVAAFLTRVQENLPQTGLPPPPERFDVAFSTADDSSFYHEPNVAPYDPNGYQWSYGEDPNDPAPPPAPRVERTEPERPRFRTDPGQTAPTRRRIDPVDGRRPSSDEGRRPPSTDGRRPPPPPDGRRPRPPSPRAIPPIAPTLPEAGEPVVIPEGGVKPPPDGAPTPSARARGGW